MNNRPGISRDIRPIRRPVGLRQGKPLPAGMPRRNHLVPPRSSERVTPVVGKWDRVWEYAQYPIVACVALAAAASPTAGQLFVLAYGFVAIFRKIPSKNVFALALVILISVPLFQALSLSGISENAAIYVYELLVVGTLRAILELNQRDLNQQI